MVGVSYIQITAVRALNVGVIMETLSIKLFFYSWEIDGKRYNSVLYVDKKQRDRALFNTQNEPLLKGITFLPETTELSIFDLDAINKAFNK